jgi:hypothetical protein
LLLTHSRLPKPGQQSAATEQDVVIGLQQMLVVVHWYGASQHWYVIVQGVPGPPSQQMSLRVGAQTPLQHPALTPPGQPPLAALPLVDATHGPGEGVGVGVGVGLPVGVGVGLPVGVGVGLPLGVGVGLPLGVAVGVGRGVGEGVAVAGGVRVGVGVSVGVGVGSGGGMTGGGGGGLGPPPGPLFSGSAGLNGLFPSTGTTSTISTSGSSSPRSVVVASGPSSRKMSPSLKASTGPKLPSLIVTCPPSRKRWVPSPAMRSSTSPSITPIRT